MTKADGKPRNTRRSKSRGGLYQRCEARKGCPDMTTSATGERVRPPHTCRGDWCATVELPSDDPKKRRRKTIVRARKADALAALRKAQSDLEKAGDLPTSSPTVAQWCELWWNRYGMKRLKVSTRPAYRSKIDNYIIPAIGKMRLDRLTVEHVYRLHDYITVTKGLGPSTALSAHRVFSAMMTDALKEGRVPRNVVRVADKPRVGKKPKVYLNNAQARQLLLSVRDDSSEAARWATALLAGPRPSERLGITREMVDLEAGILTIAWQLQRLAYQHGCGDEPCGRKRGGNCPQRHLDIPPDQEVRHVEGGLYLLRPKSRAGWRRVPMVGLLQELLREHIEAHPPGKEGLIFTRDGQRPIDPKDDALQWDAALRRAGLPDVDRHSARHTCNTVLTELGFPVDVRQAILGHASKDVNEQVYTHTSDSRIAEALLALSASMDYRESAEPPAPSS